MTEEKMEICSCCGGRGSISLGIENEKGLLQRVNVPCYACGGAGKVPSSWLKVPKFDRSDKERGSG